MRLRIKVRKSHNSALSEFIRTAPSRDKKRVYLAVLKKASESQAEILEQARTAHA